MSDGKRAVNLSLNEELVNEARSLTTNLSGVVEALLTEFVNQENAKREAQDQALKQSIAAWNSFGEQYGSFSDENSTL